jgi:hypothetical protein
VKPFEGCEECGRLWNKFAVSVHQVVLLKGRLQIAILAHDQEREQLLLPQLRGAEQERQDNQIGLERHGVEAHKTTCH